MPVPPVRLPSNSVSALVLFDIDGTLLRRAGPHHREALVEAVFRTTGFRTDIGNVPVAGMLDRDILRAMLMQAGASQALIRRHMPAMVQRAQWIYTRICPDLRRKVTPGARALLSHLSRQGVPAGLVTGNLTRIGWKKMERAGLKPYLRFGAFAELATSRAGLVKIAVREARRAQWIGKTSPITLIGDHPNDILAARANGIRVVSVGTGVIGVEELAKHSPDFLVRDLRELNWATLVV